VSPLVAILILLLLAVVILVVAAPLRTREPGSDAEPPAVPGASPPATAVAEGHARAALEAAREAKYREIRDSELDYRTGKLSAEDYAAIDAQLRAEAIEILNRLDRLDAAAGEGRGEADRLDGTPGPAAGA
jgi:hypothetical protein